jgi:two-component system chemotaxis response regulator CheY
MVVEDDDALRRLFSFVLTHSGYDVIEAEDGQEALEKFAEHPCHLIVTDMYMPRMRGTELIDELRTQDSEVYIIMVTAHGTPDMQKEALRRGANAFLAKPFDLEKLEARIAAYFEAESFS